MAAVGSFQIKRAQGAAAQSDTSLSAQRLEGELSASSVPMTSFHDMVTSPVAAQATRARSQSQSSQQGSPTQKELVWMDGKPSSASAAAIPVAGGTDKKAVMQDGPARTGESSASQPATTTATSQNRRSVNGNGGSIFSGNKVKHLKKDDGVPLWRKDIQLDFLRYVFEDNTPCFHKDSDKTPGHTFADIYIDAMALSSKTSKVLRDKLFADRQGALNMAMICLLVNVGRMNTTLNFFPEMRAQLRTFHSIPSLQVNQDPGNDKQLQDAPRLKSILKGASEDNPSFPTTLEGLKEYPVPRTNPVHLIFVLSQYAPKISEIHFIPPRDFFDLVMRTTLSSRSRAMAFLWLVWWYLESDFSEKAALSNPFGSGNPGEGTGGFPIKVPFFEHLTEGQAEHENVDTEAELQFGEAQKQERRRILESEEGLGPPPKRVRKAVINDDVGLANSDIDPARSPSPSFAMHRMGSIDNASSPLHENDTSHGRYSKAASKMDHPDPHKVILKTRSDKPLSSSPPLTLGAGNAGTAANGSRRARPETSHQKAVTLNRKLRINHILHKQMLAHQAEMQNHTGRKYASFGMMVMNRVRDLPDAYDSEDENSWGPGGLVPNHFETDDYGSEALRHKSIIDRAIRRLAREDRDSSLVMLSKVYSRRRRKAREVVEEEEIFEQPQQASPRRKRKRPPPRSRVSAMKTQLSETFEEGLDDLDMDLLGENRDDDRDDVSGGYDIMEGSPSRGDADLTEDEVA